MIFPTDPFWMDNIYCSGGEKNLTDCRFDGWGSSDCQESEAAGVVCQTGPAVRYQEDYVTTTTPPTTTSVAKSPASHSQRDMPPRLRIKVSRLNHYLRNFPIRLVSNKSCSSFFFCR